MESPGVNGNPEDVSKEDARAGSSKFGFDFFSMRGEKVDRRRAAHDLRMQMKDLQFRLRELGTTGGSDSDETIFAEPLAVGQRKTKAVYEKSPIKPEKFPGKDFNRWELWVKHYKSVAKANGWTDQQAIAALPACLTPWAVEEFETVPRKYIEKVPGEEAPIFETLLEIPKLKMQQYRSARANLSEFISVIQNKNETLKEYFRRVRYLGDLALCEKTLEEKDKDLRDQILEGFFDSRLQQKLYEDETNRNFCESFTARTGTGIDPEKHKGCAPAARQDDTSRQSAIFLGRLGAGQCSQGQLPELSLSGGREICSTADVDGHSGESTGQA